MKSKQIHQLQTFVKKQCKKRGIDEQTIDFEAELDRSLNFSENKYHFEGILNTLSMDFEEQLNKSKSALDKHKVEREQEREKLIEKYKENLKLQTEIKSLEKYYSRIKLAIERLRHNTANGVFIIGSTGLGKSHSIENYLNHYDMDYIETTNVTESYLYRLMYENNGKTIWIRDNSKTVTQKNTIDFLKSALEQKKEMPDGSFGVLITHHKYSKENKDIDKEFIWTGNLIVDLNTLQDLKHFTDFEALQSRVIMVHLGLSKNDISDIMNLICVEEWEIEVTDFLKSHAEELKASINLRTQQEAFMIYKHCEIVNRDWKKVLIKEINQNQSEVRQLIYAEFGDEVFGALELKRLMLQKRVVNTTRTAERRINDFLLLNEFYEVGKQDNERLFCLREID